MFKEKLDGYIALIEGAMPGYLQISETGTREYPVIMDAVKYSALAGGKRIRPVILLAVCELYGGKAQDALPFACALEMIHTYSLIHDDLPCMDDDDLRRGKPTNHKVYGEAIAVLAGDALLTRAFETVLDPQNIKHIPAARVLRTAGIMARAAGMDGMIGGQVIDMESEGKAISLARLETLQTLKTGSLLQAAAMMGCVLAGREDADALHAAGTYGAKLGLAFQIRDDILDVEGDESLFGKPVGSDAENGKSTFPSLLGLDACKKLVLTATQEAVAAIADMPRHEFLSELAHSLADRIS